MIFLSEPVNEPKILHISSSISKHVIVNTNNMYTFHAVGLHLRELKHRQINRETGITTRKLSFRIPGGGGHKFTTNFKLN